MLYDIQSLINKYKGYSNLNQKISIECKKGKLIRIKRGLYTDDLVNDTAIMELFLNMYLHILLQYMVKRIINFIV